MRRPYRLLQKLRADSLDQTPGQHGANSEEGQPSLDELLAEIQLHEPKAERATGDHGFIVALGDIQFGKIDGDGFASTLGRTIAYLDKAADALESYR